MRPLIFWNISHLPIFYGIIFKYLDGNQDPGLGQSCNIWFDPIRNSNRPMIYRTRGMQANHYKIRCKISSNVVISHHMPQNLIKYLIFQGVLDLLANRCLASGTNAWTDTDHTCYTMTNAGSEGFLKLLPIYVEHILYPTITVRIVCELDQRYSQHI